MKIKNSIKTLPWHDTRTWSKRNRYGVDKIIVHQSLSDSTTSGVNNYHINPNHISNRGLPHIAYHYSIDKNGDVHWCNLLNETLAHTRGQNTKAIGIVINGNFLGDGYDKGTQEPTQEQLNALKDLLNHLLSFELADIGITKTNIHTHAEFGKPACPGHILSKFIDDYKQEIIT